MTTSRIRGRKLQKRNRRFLSQHPLCAECQKAERVRAAQEVDHVVPLFKGGMDEWENLQGLCIDCHKAKTEKDMGRVAKGCDASGVPLDPGHRWHAR